MENSVTGKSHQKASEKRQKPPFETLTLDATRRLEFKVYSVRQWVTSGDRWVGVASNSQERSVNTPSSIFDMSMAFKLNNKLNK